MSTRACNLVVVDGVVDGGVELLILGAPRHQQMACASKKFLMMAALACSATLGSANEDCLIGNA